MRFFGGGAQANQAFQDRIVAAGGKPDGGITRRVGDWYGDLTGRNQAFEKESEFARSMALEAWQRETEYNHPAAQMERLKAAGLNPHLMYGQGTTGNTSASVPNTPKAQPNNLLELLPIVTGMVGFIKDQQVKDAQINNLQIGASQKSASTELTIERLNQMKEMFPFLFTQESNKIGLQDAQLQAMRAGTDKTKQEVINLMLGEQKLGEELKNFPLQREKLNEEINNLIRSGNLLTADADIRQQEKIKRDFENEILKIQTDLMTKGIPNPQQVILLLINAILGYARPK